jgi:hypothetical protein
VKSEPVSLVARNRGLATTQVLLVCDDRPAFGTRDELRDFARAVLRCAAEAAPHVRHLELTVHGPGPGTLDEAVGAQIEGLVAAIRAGEAPARLETITIVDRDPLHAARVATAVARILGGADGIDVPAVPALPATPPPSAPSAAAAVDVFISYKSDDTAHAQQVRDALVSHGLRVFFSRESLPRLGSDDYHRQIDGALEQARHLVVVTSSGDNAMAQWVEYEWRLFLGEKLAGRKAGNLITVIAGAMTIADLPLSLRHREVVRLAPAELPKLLEYLRPPDS